MNVVAVKNLKEGWVLGEDVRDINGRLMLSKGNKIGSKHIRIFKIWGVSEVIVEQDHEPAPPPQGDKNIEKLNRAERTTKLVMQHIDIQQPGMIEIFNAAVAYRYEHHLFLEMEVRRPIPKNFKLDLSNGLGTQIEFGDIKLPDAPSIILDFNRVVEDPLSSIHDIADVVKRSPSLAALLLRLANSAFYGFPSKVDTISRAISLIGTREISTLILGINVMGQFHDISKELVDISSFIKHSLSCGILSRILGAQKKMPHTERLFVAGLLHDIGRLVWYKYFPEQAKLLLKMSEKTGRSLYEIETECLGISHEQIAKYLLRKWDFPASLENSVVYHHRPTISSDNIEAGIVHIADMTINALGMGHSGERIIPHCDPKAWDSIQIAPSALEIAIEQTIQQLDIMEALFVEL